MLDMNALLSFFDRTFVLKFFLVLLLLSLLPLADGYLLLLSAPFAGTYAVLALTASTGFFGLILVMNRISRLISLIRRKVKDGRYPAHEYDSVAGCVVAGILLIIPGFVTDGLGLLCFLVPGLASLVGKIVTSRLEGHLKLAYEYMKIEEC